MKSTTTVFGLLAIAGGVLAVISDERFLRLVAVVVAVGSAVILGISLGSKPFRKS